MSRARLRLSKLEAALARQPRPRCMACAEWPDEYCVVDWPDRPVPAWVAPSSPTTPQDFWPEERRCPHCGRTPLKVTTIRVTYVDGFAWRHRVIAPPSNRPHP